MGQLDELIKSTAAATGLDPDDVRAFTAVAERREYPPGAILFHESTPREWVGIVVEGEVKISTGLTGHETELARLGPGSMVSEIALVDDAPHTATGHAPKGATVLTVPTATLRALADTHPDRYYRMVSRVAQLVAHRMRSVSEQLSAAIAAQQQLGGIRTEHDSLGTRELPAEAYYGVQTLRATENFQISGIKLRKFGHLVHALAYVKKAAALANLELGSITQEKADAIVRACDEIMEGKLREDFVVDMVQGGAGTSTNMNANEVIANRGLELLGHQKGEYQYLHPNDDVNCSQSTNDVYPTSVKLGVYLSLQDAIAALEELRNALKAKAVEFNDVIKMGRTQLQDAVPMTLGQEFGAYAVMIGEAVAHLRRISQDLLAMNMGATAIGTGITSPPGYAELVTAKLAEVTGLPICQAENLVEATQDSGDFVAVSATLKRAAVQLSKICNDLRLLSSGPRAGLGEINLPAMQPGSSIMPGKVNPVIPEVVSQVCFQLIGYDMTVTMAAEASQLELNMAEPVMAYDLMMGTMMLRNAAITLTSRCITGITANREHCRDLVNHSIGLVTALVPKLGYEQSAAIAKKALKTGESVYDLVLQDSSLTKDELDELLSPEKMTAPRSRLL
ncbi:aspartate ammonia-lyase [Nocardia sp. CDC153]|nr:aspartate ammonia-lyase [Nocardia sp. CDC153]MEC3951419.1 aspartate ammonia-lyase [Nocardia sp. CDC153]